MPCRATTSRISGAVFGGHRAPTHTYFFSSPCFLKCQLCAHQEPSRKLANRPYAGEVDHLGLESKSRASLRLPHSMGRR